MEFVIVDDPGILLKPASKLRKAVCYDSSEMWGRAASYLIEDADDDAEDWHKKAKHVHQKARRAGLMYENRCLPENK